VRDREGEAVYHIDANRCTRCGECVDHFVRGCYMRKVLTTAG
jgi:phosphoadenosine phosphosulfate reductase